MKILKKIFQIGPKQKKRSCDQRLASVVPYFTGVLSGIGSFSPFCLRVQRRPSCFRCLFLLSGSAFTEREAELWKEESFRAVCTRASFSLKVTFSAVKAHLSRVRTEEWIHTVGIQLTGEEGDFGITPSKRKSLKKLKSGKTKDCVL